MDVVIFVVALLALTAYVAAPLYRPPPAIRASGEQRRQEVIQLLRELEWDRREGLVDDEEYRARRRALESEAVELWTAGD